ncbi:MAG TPA: hypothetical protein VGO93_17650, partial [Candidatus Xenobia bacterium]
MTRRLLVLLGWLLVASPAGAERLLHRYDAASWTATGQAWGFVDTVRPGLPAHPHPESLCGGETAT